MEYVGEPWLIRHIAMDVQSAHPGKHTMFLSNDIFHYFKMIYKCSIPENNKKEIINSHKNSYKIGLQ